MGEGMQNTAQVPHPLVDQAGGVNRVTVINRLHFGNNPETPELLLHPVWVQVQISEYINRLMLSRLAAYYGHHVLERRSHIELSLSGSLVGHFGLSSQCLFLRQLYAREHQAADVFANESTAVR